MNRSYPGKIVRIAVIASVNVGLTYGRKTNILWLVEFPEKESPVVAVDVGCVGFVKSQERVEQVVLEAFAVAPEVIGRAGGAAPVLAVAGRFYV